MALPGWNSLELTTKIHSGFEIAGILFLGLLVVSEAFAYMYGHRRDALIHIAENARLEQQHQNEQEAAKKIAELAERQSKRTLSSEKKKQLTEVLAPYRGTKVSVNCIMGDTEGKQLAEDIVFVLVAAGWDLGSNVGVNQSVYDKDPSGVEVTINEGEARSQRIPPASVVLMQNLHNYGFAEAQKLFVNPGIPADMIEIRIGKKP